MKVKKNDTVLVLTGKDAGKTAKVLTAMPSENRIIVDGVNVQKKHKKARSAQEVSAIQNQAGPIDASNVMVVCPECGKATRIKHAVVDGKKVRVCKCGAVLDKAYSKKAAAKAAAHPPPQPHSPLPSGSETGLQKSWYPEESPPAPAPMPHLQKQNPSFQKILQSHAGTAFFQLVHGLTFDLPGSLLGNPQHPADLLQGVANAVIHAEM